MENNEQKSLDIIRQAVDSILNVNSTIKKRNKTQFDKQRELFLQILQQIEALKLRSNLLYADLKLDYSTYDEPFLELIDLLLLTTYGKECYELISFYIWERVNPDQSVNALIGKDGTEIILTSPLDLWNMMCIVIPSLNE